MRSLLLQRLILPLLLLFAQQGALLHGLGHHSMAQHTAAAWQEHSAPQGQHLADGLCDDCLSFAQVAIAYEAAATPPALLGHLSYGFSVDTPAPHTVAPLPAVHNRGPPLVA